MIKEVHCYFLDPMRIKESNETKVLAIREVMKIFKPTFRED